MGVVIDTNCLAKVLDPRNEDHPRFAPIWEWIYVGRGRMIYGGTKYIQELSRMSRFLRLVAELSRNGRVIILPKASVDEICKELKSKITDAAFNDEHLVAIVITSGCRIVCTDDLKAIPYLKNVDLYAEYGRQRPKIYSKPAHSAMCCDKNLPAMCLADARVKGKRRNG